MEDLKKLLQDTENQSAKLIKEKNTLVIQVQRTQQRIQQIDLTLVALSGKADAYRGLLEPKEPTKRIPGKRQGKK